MVKVVVSTSRPEVTRSHAWGLAADITNISPEAIVIHAHDLQLIVQPEVAQTKLCTQSSMSFLPIWQGGNDSQIVLQAGEHYMFFWTGEDASLANLSPCSLGRWQKLGEVLNFVPGPYTFAVLGKVRPIQEPEGSYHTFAEAVTVKISITQMSIMFFAGIGAFLAYCVVCLQDGGDFDRIHKAQSGRDAAAGWFVLLRNAFSAGLLGAVLAVVASRLSDTQFPVKVSVNDIWGALTIGFVSYFVGNGFINKLKQLSPAPPPPAPAPAPAPALAPHE